MNSCLKIFGCQIVLFVGLAAAFGGGTINCPCIDALLCDPETVADPIIACDDSADVACCSDDARTIWTAFAKMVVDAEDRSRLGGLLNQTRREREMFAAAAAIYKPTVDKDDEDVDDCACFRHRDCDLDVWHRFGDKDSDFRVFGSPQPCADPRQTLCCPGPVDDVIGTQDNDVIGNENDDVIGTEDDVTETAKKEDVYAAADEICPCMRRFDCPALPYGLSPTDIRDYGALPHCKSLWNIRCCPRAEESLNQRSKREAQALLDPVYTRHNRVCPCMARRLCRHLPEYGRVPTDVRDFGQLVPCALPNRIRCCPRYHRLGKRQAAAANQEQNQF